MIDYEKLAEQWPEGPERAAKLRKYWYIEREAGRALREEAARYRDRAVHMSGPGGVNDTYEGMNRQQVLEKSRELFAQAAQVKREAIAAFMQGSNKE